VSVDPYMSQALSEGRKAFPACLPNPPVGCVIVQSGAISGRGHTKPPGSPNAEIGALAASRGDLTDATLYVTLEPCSFHGRTPSCAEAIIASGIRHVVVAIVDPDPRNNGAGIEKLRAAGITVRVGIMEEAARTELGPYLNLPSNKVEPTRGGSRHE
jgi:riboflavin biosynthesis protein RibD